jgi:hypothetical protein
MYALDPFHLLDLLRALDNLFLPVVILGIQLERPESVLTGCGTDYLLIVNMQRNTVSVRQFLRQRCFVVALDFLQVACSVDYSVKPYAGAMAQAADITL